MEYVPNFGIPEYSPAVHYVRFGSESTDSPMIWTSYSNRRKGYRISEVWGLQSFGKVGQEHFIEAFEDLKEIWNDSWTRNRLRNKLSESTLLNSLDHHWLLPAERRLAERAGVEFLKFAAEYFDVPYTPLERTARHIEDRESETYLDYLDGKIVHGDAALARDWLPFVACDPIAEELSPYTIQDVREYGDDDMDEFCPRC